MNKKKTIIHIIIDRETKGPGKIKIEGKLKIVSVFRWFFAASLMIAHRQLIAGDAHYCFRTAVDCLRSPHADK